MLEMSLQTIVNAIVSLELQRKGRNNEGLLFSFDVQLVCYRGDDGEHFSSRRVGLHLLYQVNEGYSYINVFSVVTKNPFAVPAKSAGWKHEVTHDSCWRSDVNAFSRLYFELAEEINQALESAGHKRVAPRDMTQHVYESHNMFRWVACTISKDPADDRGYRRILTLGAK